MKHIAAYLLCKAGGVEQPTKEQVAKILGAAGINFSDSDLETVCNKMNASNVEQLVAKGKAEIAKVAGGSVAPTSTSKAEAPKPVAKKEEEAQAAAPLDLGDMFGDF